VTIARTRAHLLWQRMRSNRPLPPAAARVLVVDDDAVIRSLIAVALSVEGFDIVEASDGRAALDLLPRVKPDVITLDATMPEISGWEVAVRIRADPMTAGIKVLLLTAAPADIDAQRRELVRVDACLDKPFDPDELVAIVRKLTA
jgi:CheY-like chemotaxis protein